jgi:hypothetical protein
MLECEKLEGVGYGFFLKSRSAERDPYRKEYLSGRMDHTLTKIVQNKWWSSCISPGKVVTVGFPRYAPDRRKNQPENLVPG